MNRRPATGLGVGILVLLISGGCMTTALRFNARPRPSFTEVLGVRAAFAVGEEFYINIEARMDEDASAQAYELRLPQHAVDSQETPQSAGTHVQELEALRDGPKLTLVPSGSLAPWESPPLDARPVPIRRLSLGQLVELIPDSEGPRSPEVLVVTLTEEEAGEFSELLFGGLPWTSELYSAQEAAARHFIAVATGTGPIEYALADIYDGLDRQRGWYALMPLAVAFDAVTSPVQAIIILAASP